MAEYSRVAKGSFTQSATGLAVPIYLPFQPSLVKVTNFTAYAAFALHGIPWATWDVSMGQGFASVGLVAAGPALRTDNVIAGGISTFGAGLSLRFGPQVQVTSIVKATNVVTTQAAHGLATGDVVFFEGLYQSATTGMPQICGIPFTVTVTAPTTFTFVWNINQSQFTAISGNPAGAYVRKILNPYLYLPGVNFVEAITTGTTTTITTSTSHNFVVGQEIAFRIPAAYGTTQLNSLPNNVIPGSPIYGYVTSVAANNQFVCNIDSSAFSAFFTNIPVASVPGLQFPQVVAVGDVNTGGTAYSGGALYPSPSFPTFSGGVSTINGPAISGAFVNNTRQGFVIGAGAAVSDASSNLSGATSDVIYWEAYIPDMAIP